MGVVQYPEAEWSPAQANWLLAHLANKAEPRGAHGILMSEATDSANQFAFEANRQPLMDWAAAAVGAAQEKYYKANPDAARAGHLWGVHKRTE